MKNKLLLALLIVLVNGSFLFSQSLKLETYGISPRDAAVDTMDIFTSAYNGLMNVGVQTKMFLKGQVVDTVFNTPTWTLLSKPAGSSAELGDLLNLNDTTQIRVFTPDVAGKYEIQFSDGALTQTITINAGLFVGVENGTVNCVVCHNNEPFDYKFDNWKLTGHSSMLERGLDGTLSDHYSSSCISCHTTGYDPNASNNGFDDFGFVFPDTLYPGVYELMMNQYPDAMKLANIQCESCHGPGSEHYGLTTDSRMVAPLDVANCAWCHDSGDHHFFPEQWDNSGHGMNLYPEDRNSCAPCHSGEGFVDWVNGGKVDLIDGYSNEMPIGCATCHDPHDASLDHQLRTLDVTLVSGQEITEGGYGKICMNCHRSRRDAVAYVSDYLLNASHFGPHHGPQAEVLSASNVWTFGQILPTSPHLIDVENSFVICHMYISEEAEGIPIFGVHTFSMADQDGNDNVEACANCHGNIGTSFADKKYYINGNADLDGNGTAEGLQIEMQGLLDYLATFLPIDEEGEVVIDSTVTLNVAAATYNYLVVLEDRSLGIHNPAFTFALLKASIEAVGGVVNVEPVDNNLPNSYVLEQNYPNPFNPETKIQFSVPENAEVSLVIYDAIGNEIETLVSEQMAPGKYSYSWNASKYASGIYFYKLTSNNFVKVNKMVLIK